ncbi:MAG: carbohydrate ABC transporter permease, partial [Actinobacteria bacterium]|nr:carbohydrate ABC transporter permease [Actinomycetota bacterium]
MDNRHKKINFRRNIPVIVKYIILSITLIIVLIPIIMLINGALKTRGEFLAHPYNLPIPPRWENFIGILEMKSFWRFVLNSFFVTIATTIGTVFICSMAAFAIARIKFRGKTFVFNFLTLGLMFPVTIAILPVYLVVRQIGLIDNLWGVILVHTSFQLSFGIIILNNFFKSIPSEIQDASHIDGCSYFGFYWHILIRLSRPALASVAAIAAVFSWNDLIVPLVMLNSENLWTLPLGTMQFQGQYGTDWAMVGAFVTLSTIPAIILYLFIQRNLISGLTAGS